MNRIDRCFAELAGRKALIPFITAGDPNPGLTVALMDALVAGGADILELGVPFSDPMADGPVIQRASERALVHGVGLRDVLAMVAEFRQHNTTPVVLMGYLNPVEAMGYGEFAQAARAAPDQRRADRDHRKEEGSEAKQNRGRHSRDQKADHRHRALSRSRADDAEHDANHGVASHVEHFFAKITTEFTPGGIQGIGNGLTIAVQEK